MDRHVARALRGLEGRLNEAIVIRSVADEAGLSLHHFHRLFVSEMGETPAGYLRRIRLDAASHRLRWTDESVGSIAFSLGYSSQAAFTRAFRRRFGETPERFRRAFVSDHDAAAGVFVRDIEPLRILGRRYRGDLGNMVAYWEDFVARAPRALIEERQALFVGLLYDDPRVTPPEQQRYDCCVTVPAGFADDTGELASDAMHVMETRAGHYGCLRHVGPWQEIALSYHRLCDGWAAGSRYSVTDDPCIEIHAVPRHLMPRERIDMTILLPIV